MGGGGGPDMPRGVMNGQYLHSKYYNLMLLFKIK